MHVKQKVLESLDIGNGVAERERESLKDFFYESNEWKRLKNGSIDLVFGAKGSGKSALFFNLLENEYELEQEGKLLISSENIAGGSVFEAVRRSPPKHEDDYEAIWKLYLLVLIVDRCGKDGLNVGEIKIVEDLLVQEGIYHKGKTISSFFANVTDYVKSRLNFDTFEGEFEFNETTGLPNKIKGKMTFSEPPERARKAGYVSINDALFACNKFLIDAGKEVWILIDRLDIIFSRDRKAESLAIRALFRVYSDLYTTSAIRLKIFLRDDIWRAITKEEGFREASHLVNAVSIQWDKQSLASLLIQRLIVSENFRSYYSVDRSLLIQTIKKKMDLINKLFPREMTLFGEGRERAFNWLIIYTRDGQGTNTPRDLVELLNFAIQHEIERLNRGENPYKSRYLLFNHEALSAAGGKLSKLKVEQTLFAEHPELRAYIEAFFESIPRNFEMDKLEALWGVDTITAKAIAAKLTDIGFLKQTGRYKYLIPVLFTHYLGINPSRRKFSK